MAKMTEITCKCGCGRKRLVRTADVQRGWGGSILTKVAKLDIKNNALDKMPGIMLDKCMANMRTIHSVRRICSATNKSALQL